MKKIYVVLALSFCFFACDDDGFLDKSPSISESIEIRTLDDVDKLFNELRIQFNDDNTQLYSTDNTTIVQSILDEDVSNRAYREETVDAYLFSTIPNQNFVDINWRFRYGRLRVPNLALEAMNSGDLEPGDATLEAILRAESHFFRAYHLFELATVYGLYPSSENENEPGIVLRQTTSFVESLERATLKETFDFILNELEEALKYPDSEEPRKPDYDFRIGKAAVNALAARIHLYLGDYINAENFANEALQGYDNMVNYALEITVSEATLNGVTSIFPSTRLLNRRNLSIPEFYSDRYFYLFNQSSFTNISPSQELMDLYDNNDIRKSFFVKGWFSRFAGVTTDTWYTYMKHDPGIVSLGLSVPEMYLTRAECKARNNDINGAMADLEEVRINRFDPTDYAALAMPNSGEDALDIIVEERRREIPFGVRFMDIKRINNDPLTGNDVTITRVLNGETITIGPDDRRWARPIGQEVINLSGGQTQQNEY